MSRLLIRRACVIDTEPEPVAHRDTDVLIDGDRISAIGHDLPADDAEVIDGTARIVLPGFVDTHRHGWQAGLRGIATTGSLADYLELVGRTLCGRYRPTDVHFGTLASALECLDGGTTTVQDYSHIQYGPAHTDAALTALSDAGIRAVFGYALPLFVPEPDPAELRAELFRVRDAGGPLVRLAFAVTGPSYGPIERAVRDWALAAELGVPALTHVGSGPVAAKPIAALRDAGVDIAGTLFVHGNSLSDDELALIAETGAALTTTPAVEAQMGHGGPMLNRLRAAGVRTGLGTDVVTSNAGDMFTVMRAALLSSQLADGPSATPAEVLRLATIGGADVLGMADRVGSLQPGKQADLMVLRADTPNLAAGWHDPIGTVVSSAHPGNVETVLVAGNVVKRDGKLVHPWTSVAEELARSAVFLTAS